MSWVSAIIFLQQSLDQHDLSLCGNVSNRRDGVWRINNPGEFSFGQPIEDARRGREGLASRIVSRTSRRRADTFLFPRLIAVGFWKPEISPTSYGDRPCKM